MGGSPSKGTPADGRLATNQSMSGSTATPPAVDPDMPQMSHQLIAPPATCIEPGEASEPRRRPTGR